MRRTGKELKALARRAMLGRYGTLAGAILVYYLIVFAVTIPLIGIMVFLSVAQTDPSIPLIVAMVICYLVLIAISLVASAGLTRICYQICVGKETGVGDILYGFFHRPLRFIGLLLLVALISMVSALPGALLLVAGGLWNGSEAVRIFLRVVGYLALLIPLVIVTIQYSFALYILIENPAQKVVECLRFSRELARGNKLRLVKLGLSFAGIYLLCYLSLGVGYLWGTPYMICSSIFLYLSIKEESYPVTTADEYPFD